MSDELDEPSDLESEEPYVPKRTGWPMWDLEAEKILSGIRAHIFDPSAIGIVALGQRAVQKGENNSDIAFHDFLRILDAFLSQLIQWAEWKELGELHNWAGQALSDRLQFLWTQKGDWCSENEGFNKRWMEFGDKRHTRSPRSYLGWLAGDYLRKLIHERVVAGVMLSPSETEKESASFAEIATYPKERILWLTKLCALPDFSRDSHVEWANIVFERMQQEEQKILNSPPMRKCQTRDSRERRRSGELRLYDFKRTIVGAVKGLAAKPTGQIRGITRPA
jgi:hypothetical protein